MVDKDMDRGSHFGLPASSVSHRPSPTKGGHPGPMAKESRRPPTGPSLPSDPLSEVWSLARILGGAGSELRRLLASMTEQKLEIALEAAQQLVQHLEDEAERRRLEDERGHRRPSRHPRGGPTTPSTPEST